MLTCFPAHSKKDPSWLKIKIGEILTTVDDQPRQQQYKWFQSEFKVSNHVRVEKLTPHLGWSFKDAHQTAAYKATNSAGNRGCEYLVRCSSIHSFDLHFDLRYCNQSLVLVRGLYPILLTND
jgi:hypothetical protein